MDRQTKEKKDICNGSIKIVKRLIKLLKIQKLKPPKINNQKKCKNYLYRKLIQKWKIERRNFQTIISPNWVKKICNFLQTNVFQQENNQQTYQEVGRRDFNSPDQRRNFSQATSPLLTLNNNIDGFHQNQFISQVSPNQLDGFTNYYRNNEYTLTDFFTREDNIQREDASPMIDYQNQQDQSQFLSNNASQFQTSVKHQNNGEIRINGKQKKKFNKGLKMLSVIVKDIVIEKKNTTYKEVAEIILKDSLKYDNLNLSSKQEIAKEEQNIKRRVYDALNVLISAGILIKENKRVRKNDNNQKIQISNKRMHTNTLRSKIKNKQYALEEKMQVYECMQKQLEDLKGLIQRNQQQKQDKCLNFPFLIIEPSNLEGTVLDMQMQNDFKKLSINSNNELVLHGDLEVISLLNQQDDPFAYSTSQGEQQFMNNQFNFILQIIFYFFLMSNILPRYRNNQIEQYSTINHIQQNQPQILNQQAIQDKDQQLAIKYQDDIIQIIQQPNTQSLMMTGHDDQIYSVDFSKEGSYLVSCDKQGFIFLWDISNGQNLTAFKLFSNAINQIKFYDKDHNIIGCSADLSIKLIDTENQKTVRNFKGHSTYINSIDYNNKGIVISVDNKGQVFEWDKKCKKYIAQYKYDYSLLSVMYDPKQEIYYTAGIDNKIYAYDKLQNKIQKIYEGHQDSITGLKVSYEGSYMLSNSMDNSLKLWDIRKDSIKVKGLKTYRGIYNTLDGNLLRGDINFDGSKIVSGSSNGEVLIWNSNTKKILMKLQGHEGTVNQCVFHPKKNLIASVSNDGRILLTNIDQLKIIYHYYQLQLKIHYKLFEYFNLQIDIIFQEKFFNDFFILYTKILCFYILDFFILFLKYQILVILFYFLIIITMSKIVINIYQEIHFHFVFFLCIIFINVFNQYFYI